MEKKDYLDYLDIKKSTILKKKLAAFLDDKKNDFFPMNVLKKLICFMIYAPRKVVHYRRKRSFAKFYHQHHADINKLLQLVDDDVSREVIKAQINFFSTFDCTGEQEFLHKKGLYEKHLSLIDADEYFPAGIINLSESEGFVDGGGFDGDTIKEFIKRTNGKFCHIFSFEADKNNFKDLLATVKQLELFSEKISCYLKGVYSKNGICNFSLKGIGSSISNEGGGESIEVVALDSFLNEDEKSKITFIKLDIEGSELAALEGMQEIIRQNKPKLAICVYHKPDDFWEIPFYIKSLRPDYKIYFRQHALSRTDTVCYAV